MHRSVIFSPYNRFRAISFPTSLLLWLKRGPACYIWGEGDRGVRRYSVLEYFPFNPMNNKFNDDTRAALGGDSHVTDTEKNIF